MTVYFLSQTPAALKLNGIYAGVCDLFERRVQIDLSDGVLAELVPDGNLQPLNFFITEKFLHSPPDFTEVYLMPEGALIYIKRYYDKCAALKVLRQTRFCGNLITLYSQGGIFLSCEGQDFALYELDDSFADAEFREEQAGGFPLLIVRGDGCIAAVSDKGKRVFINRAESYSCGDMLETIVNYETCAGIKAYCEFSYDGEEVALEKTRTEETCAPPEELLHFAFFESVLTRADVKKYLCPELLGRAEQLNAYLGEFTAVTVPTDLFVAAHGNIPAAGLVYPEGKNLFRVRYFAVEYENKLISNVYET